MVLFEYKSFYARQNKLKQNFDKLINFKEPGKSLSTPLLIIGGTNVGIYLIYYFTKKLQVVPWSLVCPDV